MTLQFQRGSTPSRHVEPQSVSCRSLSSTSVKSTTAEIVTSLTVAGAPVIGLTPVEHDSETVQVLDTTGVIDGSVTTLQAALDALVLASGASDVAVVSITAGQTLALSANVTFAEVQRRYRRVVVRGDADGRNITLAENAVVSAAASTNGPGPNGDGWTVPTMTTALVASAHVGQIALNTTTGRYFAVYDNDTTDLEVCAARQQLYAVGYSPYVVVYDNDEQQRAAFAALDNVLVFTPTTTITCGATVELTQMPAGIVEFQELAFELTDGCNIHSNERVYFRGCSIDLDDVNASGNNDIIGPISAVTTLDGCVTTNVAEDSGLLSNTLNNRTLEPYIVLNSYMTSGFLTNSTAEASINYMIVLGSVLQGLGQTSNPGFTSFDMDRSIIAGLNESNIDHGQNVRIMSSTIGPTLTYTSISNCQSVTLRDCLFTSTVALYYCNAVTIDSSHFLGDEPADGQLILQACGVLFGNSNVITPASPQPYGLVASKSRITNFPATVTNTTTVAIDLRYGSSIIGSSSGNGGPNTGLGISLGYGCSITCDSGAPYDAAFTTVAGNNIKVGDNASVTFATIAAGLAADVNDYATASPLMAYAVFSP
jgi:hypothetical protein